METELKDLVGKKVNKIFMDSEYLRFVTDEQGTFTYRVEGDCCSSSYFYDFYGVKNLLENGKIKEIKTVELLPSDVVVANSNHYDVIRVYGYQITTEGEYGEVTSVFSFRNSSNGYYGGWIQRLEGGTDKELPEVTEDISEVKLV